MCDSVMKGAKRFWLLTFGLDGCCVDREVGVPGQVSWPDDVLAEAAGQPRQAGGLQVKRLSRLHCKLGTAAVPERQAVWALEGQTQQHHHHHHHETPQSHRQLLTQRKGHRLDSDPDDVTY